MYYSLFLSPSFSSYLPKHYTLLIPLQIFSVGHHSMFNSREKAIKFICHFLWPLGMHKIIFSRGQLFWRRTQFAVSKFFTWHKELIEDKRKENRSSNFWFPSRDNPITLTFQQSTDWQSTDCQLFCFFSTSLADSQQLCYTGHFVTVALINGWAI